QAAQVRGNYRELLSECRNNLSPLIPTLGPAMQKYEWVAGTGNDIVHTKAVDNFGVMLPGFGHDDLLCFPLELAGADSNSEFRRRLRKGTGELPNGNPSFSGKLAARRRRSFSNSCGEKREPRSPISPRRRNGRTTASAASSAEQSRRRWSLPSSRRRMMPASGR